MLGISLGNTLQSGKASETASAEVRATFVIIRFKKGNKLFKEVKMPQAISNTAVSVEKLRWRLDPDTLSFETTRDLKPLKEIIGQERGVEAFRFGINIDKSGYNVWFVVAGLWSADHEEMAIHNG